MSPMQSPGYLLILRLARHFPGAGKQAQDRAKRSLPLRERKEVQKLLHEKTV